MLNLTVKGGEQFRELARDLRRGKGTLRSELTKAFKDAGKDTLDRVKNNMTTMDIKGFPTGKTPRFSASTSGGGIRKRIARVTELEVRTGAIDPKVRFEVKVDRLGNAREVPFHLDSGKKFRHPIMGFKRRNGVKKWRGAAASQGKPWFRDEIRKDLTLFRDRCDTAITRTVQTLERG